LCLNSNEEGNHDYTLLLSQYDLLKPIRYSLKVYSTAPIYFNDFVTHPNKTAMFGEWDSSNAGGSVTNTSTYCINPQFELIVKNTNNIVLKLETLENISVNIVVCQNDGKRVSLATTDIVIATSGDYKNSFCFCELNNIKDQRLTIVISTYYYGEFAPFSLKVETTSYPIQLLRL
jgi:hypothetical protein